MSAHFVHLAKWMLALEQVTARHLVKSLTNWTLGQVPSKATAISKVCKISDFRKWHFCKWHWMVFIQAISQTEYHKAKVINTETDCRVFPKTASLRLYKMLQSYNVRKGQSKAKDKAPLWECLIIATWVPTSWIYIHVKIKGLRNLSVLQYGVKLESATCTSAEKDPPAGQGISDRSDCSDLLTENIHKHPDHVSLKCSWTLI